MIMNAFVIRPYQSTDAAEIIGLWLECDLIVPLNNPVCDIAPLGVRAQKAHFWPFVLVKEDPAGLLRRPFHPRVRPKK
jgi:hypothetical protein